MLPPFLLVAGALLCARAIAPAPAASGTSIRINERSLQQLVGRLAPTLAANEKLLQGEIGKVRGFGGGGTYPQIWLRDSATLMDLARFHYPREFLSSWIEEHLAHQGADGSLFDWIASGEGELPADGALKARVVYRSGKRWVTADKNSVSGDQESSAVIAAARVVAWTGDNAWLKKDIEGRSVLARCDAAMSYLLKERRDAASGLVTSGFAADWGDVSPVYADQRAIYLDDATPKVVGLYTNAMAYAAFTGLAEMHAAAGDRASVARWRGEAKALRAAAEKTLWQDKRGFYLIHRTLGRTPVFDDADIFAMGGHAVAAQSGMLDLARVGTVVDAAEKRRQELDYPTIAFSLMPPYPSGVWKHPMLSASFEYQNGGQWDWFAGRLIEAEFQNGRAALATEHLLRIARKNMRNSSLWEWHSRTGEGRGSPDYAGSAGALGTALLRGLLGVELEAAVARLTPRLGTIAADAHLVEPATGTVVEYAYRYKPGEIAFDFEVRPARKTRVAVLVPPRFHLTGAELDGVAYKTELRQVGEDRYAELVVDGKAHKLRLKAKAS